ncbi:VOC family protein [Zhouia amylolytica]|uniref:VOC family protein n=1 Tax=Zhouia amylolytica TaxID=376730 RepID=UPI0020CEA2AF|nr:VOC family protein [Zhouia amylolytica]MCQ0113086.1 VOC family protein [Zhouia amylolytica]
MKVKELILYTTNIEKQRSFYRDTLEFSLLAESPVKISFQAGSSVLSFVEASTSKPYHFAFNIPPFSENKALTWLKERVTLLPFEGEEIIDFSSWNARALYFYDADGNIVEFIARRNLNVDRIADFQSTCVLNISEVGIATTEIESIYFTLNKQKELPVFDGSFAKFCAAGDEEGLFILVNKDEKKWFPTGDDIAVTDLQVVGDYNFEYKNGIILISDKE